MAGDGAAGKDDRAEDSPSGAEAPGALANAAPVWVGAVAADGGIEAEALTEAVGRSGMGEAKLASAMTPDAASGIPLTAEPVPGRRGAGEESGAIPNDLRGEVPVGAGAVEAALAEMDPTAGPPGRPEDAAGDLGIRQARGRAGPALQAETPVSMTGTVLFSTTILISPAPPRGIKTSIDSFNRIISCVTARSVDGISCTAVSGMLHCASARCRLFSIARLEKIASLPPFKITAFPALKHRPNASAVTLGRDS